MNKQIVKTLKRDEGFVIQFKNNFDTRRNNILTEGGRTKVFASEEEAMSYAKTVLPAWMFV